MFNLDADPWETTNVAGRDRYAARQADLAARLDRVRGCAGAGCR